MSSVSAQPASREPPPVKKQRGSEGSLINVKQESDEEFQDCGPVLPAMQDASGCTKDEDDPYDPIGSGFRTPSSMGDLMILPGQRMLIS